MPFFRRNKAIEMITPLESMAFVTECNSTISEPANNNILIIVLASGLGQANKPDLSRGEKIFMHPVSDFLAGQRKFCSYDVKRKIQNTCRYHRLFRFYSCNLASDNQIAVSGVQEVVEMKAPKETRWTFHPGW
jgi:hypothetical protein